MMEREVMEKEMIEIGKADFLQSYTATVITTIIHRYVHSVVTDQLFNIM